MNVINNLDRQRFEIDVDGEFAFIEYHMNDGTVYLMHTFVPDNLRGQGLAQKLAKFALDAIR
jgi:uncharacterized protein